MSRPDDLDPVRVAMRDLERDAVARAQAGRDDHLVHDAALDNGEPVPPEFAEDRLALRYVDRFGDQMRYVAAWSCWMVWDGKRWRRDETMMAFNHARTIAREAAADCEKDTLAMKLASAQTVAAIERLARSDRRVAVTTDQWDAYPYLLNTPAGIVDLRIGKIEQGRRDLYQTKITTAAPTGDCPIWLGHLKRVFAGDNAMIGYVQRFCGYCLTGVTKEHVFAYGHGAGANGKSRFVEAVTYAMGDYATSSPMSVFTASSNDQHPTEIARLRGARLVTSSETERDRRWAESRIKHLTGGDKVAARFMRGDFFEFLPQFKLMVIGNHKPHLRTVDEAIRRRLHLWPFTVTIPLEERDPNLEAKLQAEAGGILKWMVEGCISWQREGINPPPAVLDATAAYFSAEDSFGTWLSEATERKEDHYTETSTRMFKSWRQWAVDNGEDPGTVKSFVAELDKRGFGRKRTATANVIIGIYIKPVYSAEATHD